MDATPVMDDRQATSTSETPVSTALDVATILHGLMLLQQSGEIPGFQLLGTNEDQQKLRRLYDMFGCLVGDIPDLTGLVSRDVNALNSLLERKGFSIKLQPFDSPDSVGVVSVLHLLTRWWRPGTEVVLPLDNMNGTRYKAFQLENVAIYKLPHNGDASLIRLDGSNGLNVWISPASTQEIGLGLVRHAMRQMTQQRITNYDHSGVIVPFVDLHTQPDMGWLMGLVLGDSYRVNQALQEVRIQMDATGAEAQVATAVAASRSVRQPPLIVNGPFTMWMTHGNAHELPLGVARVHPDAWVPMTEPTAAH